MPRRRRKRNQQSDEEIIAFTGLEVVRNATSIPGRRMRSRWKTVPRWAVKPCIIGSVLAITHKRGTGLELLSLVRTTLEIEAPDLVCAEVEYDGPGRWKQRYYIYLAGDMWQVLSKSNAAVRRAALDWAVARAMGQGKPCGARLRLLRTE